MQLNRKENINCNKEKNQSIANDPAMTQTTELNVFHMFKKIGGEKHIHNEQRNGRHKKHPNWTYRNKKIPKSEMKNILDEINSIFNTT